MTSGTMLGDPPHHGKTKFELLTALLDRLQMCQRALGESFAGDLQLRIYTEHAFKGVPDFEVAVYGPPLTFEALASKQRSSLKIVTDREQSQYFQEQQFYADRRFHGVHQRSQPKDRGDDQKKSRGY